MSNEIVWRGTPEEAVADLLEREQTVQEIAEEHLQAEEKACRKCGDTDKLQVDHIVPLFAGGDNSKSNLQVLCHSCHQIKTQNDFTAYQNIGRTACSTLLNLTLPNSTTPNANAETVAEEDFTVFWKKYPKKVGRGAAEKSWSKHKPDLTKVLDVIEKQKQSAQWVV